MAFTPFSKDMDIIAKLQDEPNDADGLTAEGLKAKFDEAGRLVQQYINETLLPAAAAEILSTLNAAKQYADEKVVQISSSDMAMAEYDPQRKRTDVYAYADEAADAAADAVRGEVEGAYSAARWYGKDLIATSTSGVTVSGFDTRTVTASFTPLHDGAAMLGEDGQTITVPEGASKMFLSCALRWFGQDGGIDHSADCYLLVLVDGIVAATKGGLRGNYVEAETVPVFLDVTGGEKITVELKVVGGGGYGTAALRDLRLEVLA